VWTVFASITTRRSTGSGRRADPWHQDQYYWRSTQEQRHALDALVDITVEMGALTFASGSHKQGLLSHTAISDDSQALYDQYVREQGFPVVNQAMRAGDATFHSGWLAHSAPATQAIGCVK